MLATSLGVLDHIYFVILVSLVSVCSENVLLAAFLHFVELASQKSLAWLIETIWFLEFIFYVSLTFHYLKMFSTCWKANKARRYSFSLFNDGNLLILVVVIDFKLEYAFHLCSVVAKQLF